VAKPYARSTLAAEQRDERCDGFLISSNFADDNEKYSCDGDGDGGRAATTTLSPM
jgi:hypothetical protein